MRLYNHNSELDYNIIEWWFNEFVNRIHVAMLRYIVRHVKSGACVATHINFSGDQCGKESKKERQASWMDPRRWEAFEEALTRAHADHEII